MSAETEYYTCENIDESIVFPKRKMVLNNGTETGLNALVSYVPNPLLQQVADCGHYIGWEQIQRMITGVDANGTPYIRLFVGI